jgi:hypothetical protein
VYSRKFFFTLTGSVWVKIEISGRFLTSEILLSATQAKHLLHDSDALQQKEEESPPMAGSLSTRVVGIPTWANSNATVTPEIPPPIINTSVFSAKFPLGNVLRSKFLNNEKLFTKICKLFRMLCQGKYDFSVVQILDRNNYFFAPIHK